MKNLFLLLLVTLASAWTFGGCQSPPSRVAFNIESGVVVTANDALDGWGAYVAEFHPPVEQELAVEDAFKKYQSTMLLAIDSTESYVAIAAARTKDPAEALARSNEAKQAAASALADLVSLVRRLGVKL